MSEIILNLGRVFFLLLCTDGLSSVVDPERSSSHWDLGNRGYLPTNTGLAAQVPIPGVTVPVASYPW